MATFKANPVLVQAFVITKVQGGEQFKCKEGASLSEILQGESGGLILVCTTDDGCQRIADEAMTARYRPVEGDYWVVQEDGYEYLNPRQVFNRKYSPVEPEPMRAPVRVSHPERGIADVVIESDGSVTGAPEAVQLFNDFCTSRPALLDNVKSPHLCPDCNNPVIGGGCTCTLEQRRARWEAAQPGNAADTLTGAAR